MPVLKIAFPAALLMLSTGAFARPAPDHSAGKASNEADHRILQNGGTDIGVSPSGHYVTYQGETLMLVGDSGTQCMTQNINMNHREWIDECADRGIRAVHVWSFVAPRQKQDGSVIEGRYGYVYPGVTPWARKTSGPNATDQLKQWDMQTLDDGPDGDFTHYWPRMRDLCSYARSRDILVGITVFFGWPKHNSASRPDWSYHPLNVVNGGPVTDSGNPVTKAQLIDTPGTEVWMQAWSDGWSVPKKTQWIWERMCKKFIDDLNGFGNVFFVFMDEHSYSQGNGGDHFLNFFKSRGAVWVDWSNRRSTVDWVMSGTFSGSDRNGNAVSGFQGSPVRPYLNLEGSPYQGDGVRGAIWTFSVGGGHYLFHADEGQETVKTGIMGYDPYVPGGDKGMYKRDWLGHASRFFNEHVFILDTLAPHNELVDSGAYCLADPGREYVVYSKIGSPVTFNLDLSAAAGQTLDCRFYDPRNGQFGSTFQRPGEATESFTKPDSDDWVLHAALPDGSLPSQPADPSPPDQATGVSITADLSWSAAAGATSYDVYFGTAAPGTPQGNQTQTTFDPGTMEPFTHYFWRIDSVNEAGTTTGEVWEFTTASDPGDFDGDGDVDQEDFGHFQTCLAASGSPPEPGCEDADLDSDEDVDHNDFGVFQACMSGPNVPADPGCAD